MTLKEEIRQYLNERRGDYGDEEIDNSLESLDIQKDDLSGIWKTDMQILTRLIDDEELHDKIEEIYVPPKEDPFE